MTNIHLLCLTYSQTQVETKTSTRLAACASTHFKTITVTAASDQYFLGDTLDFSDKLPLHIASASRPSWIRMGLITWKFRLILQHLSTQIPPGDLLLYHDYDFEKYPQYLHNITDSCCDYLLSSYRDIDVGIFDEGFKPLSIDIPSGFVQFYEPVLPKYFQYRSGSWAGALLVRHSFQSVQFLQALNASCTYKHLLSMLTDTTCLRRGERFSGEQAVLSLLKLCAPSLFPDLRIASIHTRNRQIPFQKTNKALTTTRFYLSQLKQTARKLIQDGL